MVREAGRQGRRHAVGDAASRGRSPRRAAAAALPADPVHVAASAATVIPAAAASSAITVAAGAAAAIAAAAALRGSCAGCAIATSAASGRTARATIATGSPAATAGRYQQAVQAQSVIGGRSAAQVRGTAASPAIVRTTNATAVVGSAGIAATGIGIGAQPADLHGEHLAGRHGQGGSHLRSHAASDTAAAAARAPHRRHLNAGDAGRHGVGLGRTGKGERGSSAHGRARLGGSQRGGPARAVPHVHLVGGRVVDVQAGGRAGNQVALSLGHAGRQEALGGAGYFQLGRGHRSRGADAHAAGTVEAHCIRALLNDGGGGEAAAQGYVAAIYAHAIAGRHAGVGAIGAVRAIGTSRAGGASHALRTGSARATSRTSHALRAGGSGGAGEGGGGLHRAVGKHKAAGSAVYDAGYLQLLAGGRYADAYVTVASNSHQLHGSRSTVAAVEHVVVGGIGDLIAQGVAIDAEAQEFVVVVDGFIQHHLAAGERAGKLQRGVRRGGADAHAARAGEGEGFIVQRYVGVGRQGGAAQGYVAAGYAHAIGGGYSGVAAIGARRPLRALGACHARVSLRTLWADIPLRTLGPLWSLEAVSSGHAGHARHPISAICSLRAR